MASPKESLYVTVIRASEVDTDESGSTVAIRDVTDLEKIVDEDIGAFQEYFCKELGNSSLSNPEVSIIKTYLWWKTHQERTSG